MRGLAANVEHTVIPIIIQRENDIVLINFFYVVIKFTMDMFGIGGNLLRTCFVRLVSLNSGLNLNKKHRIG